MVIRNCIAALAVSAFLLTPASASTYFVASAGHSKIEQIRHDGWWYSDQYGHYFDENSNTYTVGLGLDLNKYLSIEADYRKVGEFNSYAGYQLDASGEAVASTPGGYTHWTYIHGDIDGIGLSVVGHLPIGNWHIDARAGVLYHRSTMEIRVSKNASSTQFFTADPDCYGDDRLGPMLGIGIGYKNVTVEYVSYPNLGSEQSTYSDASAVMLSVKVPF